jgi:hypothetical protein
MITREKLAIYKSYHGNIDVWMRARKKSDRIIADDDWRNIDELLLRLCIVKKKHSSEKFTAETMRRLREETADDSVAKELLSLA